MAGAKLYPRLPELDDTNTPQVLLSSDEENLEEESGNEDEEFAGLEGNLDNSPPEFPSDSGHVESSKRQRGRGKESWWDTLKKAPFVRSLVSGPISVGRRRKKAGTPDRPRPRQPKPSFLEEKCDTLVLLAVGVVFAALWVLFTSGKVPSSSFRDNYLACPVPRGKLRPCIPEESQAAARALVQLVRREVFRLAELHDCGQVAARNVTVGDLLKKLSQANSNDAEIGTIENFEKVFQLLLFNSHWGISVYNSKGARITDWDVGVTCDDVLVAAPTMVSLYCWLKQGLSAAWNLLWTVTALGVLLVVIGLCVKWYIDKQRKRMNDMFILVERILDVVKDHYRRSEENKHLVPYVPINHVRDLLFQPSVRRGKERIWSRAVQWIGANESRVRVEIRRMAGEDLACWRWIQPDPPPTEQPLLVRPTNGGSWQGRAFEGHHSPSYSGAPSPCIRLKNMFEIVKKMEEYQIREYENAVLERCSSLGNVVHIYVDKRSNYGCIYFKMDSFKSAQSAFNQLHGIWFRKRLITAKFIPESKYYKWFPHASNATQPIRPSPHVI